jgi:16S rRNA (guanine(966)-N(2))-methyltransferase RsmD
MRSCGGTSAAAQKQTEVAEMRVIAGSAKGRPLIAPKGQVVRPTTDKVKGAIFSMLDAIALRRAEEEGGGGSFPFARVLDLYAGSGALGIEALSRGAQHVDFVELLPAARAAIAENLRRTGFADSAAIHAMDAATVASTIRASYDLILLDPPYNDPSLPALLESLGRSTNVAEGALVVLEHDRSVAAPSSVGQLRLWRTRYHGGTAISVFTFDPHSGAIP